MQDWLSRRLEEVNDGKFYLVDAEWNGGKKKLFVYVDCDAGISLEECRKISKYLIKSIEEEEFIMEGYNLEVSSPGIDRPLKLKRQYLKNIGRPLKIHLKDGTIQKGVLSEAGEISITLSVEKHHGKKTKNDKGNWVIPFDEIEKAFVEVRFKKLKK